MLESLNLFPEPIQQVEQDWALPVGLKPSVRVLRSSEAASGNIDRVLLDGQSLIVSGDAHQVLTMLPEQTFHTCVTSPPYWSLRDYNIEGQIGLEDSVDGYIARLVSVFTLVHRVLRPDATLWLNIGDSYTSGGRTWRAPDRKNPVRAMNQRPQTPDGLKP